MPDKPEAARIVTRPEHNEATSFAANASGPPSEAPAHNARPNDLEPVTNKAQYPNSTLAERAARAKKAAAKTTTKAVEDEDAENKGVGVRQTARKRRS